MTCGDCVHFDQPGTSPSSGECWAMAMQHKVYGRIPALAFATEDAEGCDLFTPRARDPGGIGEGAL